MTDNDTPVTGRVGMEGGTWFINTPWGGEIRTWQKVGYEWVPFPELLDYVSLSEESNE